MTGLRSIVGASSSGRRGLGAGPFARRGRSRTKAEAWPRAVDAIGDAQPFPLRPKARRSGSEGPPDSLERGLNARTSPKGESRTIEHGEASRGSMLSPAGEGRREADRVDPPLANSSSRASGTRSGEPPSRRSGPRNGQPRQTCAPRSSRRGAYGGESSRKARGAAPEIPKRDEMLRRGYDWTRGGPRKIARAFAGGGPPGSTRRRRRRSARSCVIRQIRLRGEGRASSCSRPSA